MLQKITEKVGQSVQLFLICTMTTDQIFKNYSHEAYLYILKNLKDVAIAQDVLQNTFLKVHKNIGQLREAEKVKPWLFAIARNEIADAQKKAKKYTEGNFENLQADVFFNRFCCFERFINNLPESYRILIEMAFFERLSYAEISEEMGIGLSAVKARIRRAKEILKSEFVSCCKFEMNANGQLSGEPRCEICHKYTG